MPSSYRYSRCIDYEPNAAPGLVLRRSACYELLDMHSLLMLECLPATTTPGASTMSSMQPTGAAAPSGAAVPISTSANTTSGAQAPAPMGSYGTLSSTLVPNPTTEAAQSSTMAESKSTSTTETTTSETSTTSPSTSSTVVPMSSNDATKSFNGMTAFMVALAGGVALLI